MENESLEKVPKNDNLALFKSIFSFTGKNRGTDAGDAVSPKEIQHISFLTPLANSVITRCSKILSISSKELQQLFGGEPPDNVKQPLSYARNFLEFCSYRALQSAVKQPNYLNDKEFPRLTFDMMLAWEAPCADVDPGDRLQEAVSSSNQDVEDEDGWSLFYNNSTKMAVQVDDKKTVGSEAFVRIAPVCPAIADLVTVHNLFDALTSSSGLRLHFLVYDKYLRSLEKVTKSVQNAVSHLQVSSLSLAEDEVIIDIDGTVPTQPVLQHVGMSAWPGRLTSTNYALYFEPGVGLYDKAVRYDLATDTKQVIKPELTGPLGARLFDKAVMYKSLAVAEPVYLEFPEFKGCSRRDYWLDISLEILRAHKFIRKYNMKGNQKSEVLARAILGIYRYRAVREAIRVSLLNYKTLLCFNLAESLPGGDMILETLSSRLTLINVTGQGSLLTSPNSKRQQTFPVTVYTLARLGIILSNEAHMDSEATLVEDVNVGESNPLETIVKELKLNTGRAEAAQATVDQVKVEGIDTNLAVMKELLFPLIETFNWMQRLASWEDPYKSMTFVLLVAYMMYRDWIKFMFPLFFIYLGLVMLWRRYFNRRKQLEAFKIVAPPSKNAVEQLITLQEAITQAETFIQSGNIILLKIRALLFAIAPQATDRLITLLFSVAVAIALLPPKYLMLLMFLEYFTRSMPLRKESSDRGLRRVREWWTRIPAAPVQLIKPDDKKRK